MKENARNNECKSLKILEGMYITLVLHYTDNNL